MPLDDAGKSWPRSPGWQARKCMGNELRLAPRPTRCRYAFLASGR